MTYEMLAIELDNCLDMAAREKRDYQDSLKAFLQQFKKEERSLRKRLAKEHNETTRKQLERELTTVQQAYARLGYQPLASKHEEWESSFVAVATT